MRSAANRNTFTLRRLRTPMTILIATVVLALSTTSAAAQGAPTPEPEIGGPSDLTLIDQTAWVTDRPLDLTFALTTTQPVEGLDIAVTVYGALPNRTQFQQTLDGRVTGQSLVLDRFAVADIRRPDGMLFISLPLHDPGQRRFFLRDSGVYPVRVDLRNTQGDSLDSFVTHALRVVGPPAPQRLAVANVVPLTAPVAPLDAPPLQLADGGTGVAAVLGTLEENPTMAASVLVEPDLVERLQALEPVPSGPGLLERLRTLPQAASVPATTWTAVSSSLFEDELDNELVRQFDRGDRVLRDAGFTPEAGTWIAQQSLTSEAVGDLAQRGFDRLVVREESLVAVRRDTTLLRPFAISPSRTETVPAVQADQGLSRHFEIRGEPVLNAHRLLADLMILQNDRPGQSRVAVVMPPDRWQADAAMLGAYARGLSSSPILTAATLDDAFAVTPESSSGRRVLTRQFARGGEVPVPAEPTNAVRTRINGFDSMVLADNPLPDELDQALLRSERHGLSERERAALRSRADGAVNAQLAAIDVPSDRSLRLTAREGEIPVSVQNETGYPVQLKLRVSSDKLSFTNGSERLLAVERSRITERFAVQTKTSGAFPVDVVLQSPDGTLTLERSRVTVRSTAASGVGVALSVGAGVFLLLWWFRSVVRNKRHAARARHPVGSAR